MFMFNMCNTDAIQMEMEKREKEFGTYRKMRSSERRRNEAAKQRTEEEDAKQRTEEARNE